LQILRRVALRSQRKQPNIFYSLREVATHFQVPLSMVGRVYRNLEQEGLLSRVRGSKTILQGLEYDRKTRVRGFVGLPASLSCFITLQDYRMFLIRTRRELRLRGFATAMVFLESHDAEDSTERFLRYGVDTILWLLPGRPDGPTALRLTESGVRVIGISDGGQPGLPCRYQIQRVEAITALCRDWRTAGITSVTIAAEATRRSIADERTLQSILEREGIEYRLITIADESLQESADLLTKKPAGGVMVLASAASILAFRAPRLFYALLNKTRVALIDGPVTTPFTQPLEARVDLLAVNWLVVAERLVADLISQEAFRGTSPIVFHAQYKSRTLLSEHAQRI
jgi:hypothetical protein